MREAIASPICPSSPATSPAPKTMNTAMPCAVEARKTEARVETAAMITTAAARVSPGRTAWSGVQSPKANVSSRQTV